MKYKNKADELNLADDRYWKILLHMVNGESEIDDEKFFLSPNGKTDARAELHATIDSFFNETSFDDNSSACHFPARKFWLEEKLNITNFPKVECKEYNKVLKRLNPKSVTLIFPATHINSPASMFGHTFLRINSAYDSKLLSFAINYAANADPDKTNAMLFAIKGLTGGYFGKYSLLPYYEKLREYRDTEQRDIWEYDLDLNEDETLKMFRHIWELNDTHSDYYFFTQNCSYNMLWFIESARPSIHLKEYFNYQVIPLETVHATKLEGIISNTNYRASKRTKLLKYEELIDSKFIHIPKALLHSEITLDDILNDSTISKQQKRYILEASIEFLEYSFSKNDMKKEKFLKLFHNITKARARLGLGIKLDIKTPPDPKNGHRAIRLSTGLGVKDKESVVYLGLRPAYHDLQDSNYGFLRGTQIEFLNLQFSYSDNSLKIEDSTLLSIISLTQRSEFIDSFSWRMKLGFDNDSLEDNTNLIGTIGIGLSWGNEFAYTYIMVDPLFYYDDKLLTAIDSSVGLVIDKYKFMNTNFELTKRFYDSGDKQRLMKISQNFKLSQNTQLQFKYNYIEKIKFNKIDNEQTYKVILNYYF